ncbi:MAG: response regulator transcription factor [Candidatus Izemoplasmataceae bacterium]|jgi:two-component system, OmpR family, alkaline phosphatase synthesis response regulator PhoP|uniref:response regulator transcription factor n=1 Tax=Liberiplasma polymorphum TaxID=3374570 RepID=UPI00377144D2
MVRVLIIEDELSIAKMLQYDLKQLNYEVVIEQDGLKGYQRAKNETFDIILLDLMLPSINGLDICKKLRLENNPAYVIMLTAMDDEYNKIEGFEAGADDYVTKPFSPRELTARIKAGLRRQKVEEKLEQITYHEIELNLSSFEATVHGEKVNLTLKEFELLEYLVLNKGKALSREQLLSTLWGYSYDGDTRVVDVHIFKLREKVDPEQKYIKTVRSIGYKIL